MLKHYFIFHLTLFLSSNLKYGLSCQCMIRLSINFKQREKEKIETLICVGLGIRYSCLSNQPNEVIYIFRVIIIIDILLSDKYWIRILWNWLLKIILIIWSFGVLASIWEDFSCKNPKFASCAKYMFGKCCFFISQNCICTASAERKIRTMKHMYVHIYLRHKLL